MNGMDALRFWPLVLLSTTVLAQGFSENEIGAASLGSAGAVVARVDDPSALFVNPAALTAIGQRAVSLSAVPAFQRSSYSNIGQTTWDSDSKREFLPYLAANFNWGKATFAVGATTSQFYDIEWTDDDFPGRFLGRGSQFRTDEIALGLAYALTDSLSVGASLRSLDSSYDWSRRTVQAFEDQQGQTLFYEAQQEFSSEGDDTAFGFGLLYRPSRRFIIGFSYFSDSQLDMEGQARYSIASRQNDNRVIDHFNQNLADESVSVAAWIPARATIALSTIATVRTRVEFDIEWEQWSDWTASEFQLSSSSLTVPRDWDDAITFRVGGEFQQRKTLVWRVGLAFNNTLVDNVNLNPNFPDADQFMFGFGVGYGWEQFTFEGAYKYTQYRDRPVADQEFSFSPQSDDLIQSNGQVGTYETQRHRFSLGVTWHF